MDMATDEVGGGQQEGHGKKKGEELKMPCCLLYSASTDDQLRAVFAELREMSLSGMDLHLRCLSTTAELAQFVAMLVAQMECRRDFDLAQSLLAAFLNIHHSALWTTKPDGRHTVFQWGASKISEIFISLPPPLPLQKN